MAFYQESNHYEKTIISDLQGSWGNLRDAVIKEHQNTDCSKLLFHIDEAMSWESVRDLEYMKQIFLVVQSLSQKMNLSSAVMEWIEEIRDVLHEILNEIKNGNKL